MKGDRLESLPFFLAAVVISSLPIKKCPNRLRHFWERREEEIGLGITAGGKKCRVPSHMSGSKSIHLSRGVATWIPHLYSGHSEGQAQDCHLRPGQGEPWVVLGTLGVGLGKLNRVYIIRFGCGRE